MVYLPASLLDGQMELSPTLELWYLLKANSIEKATTTKAAYEDNGITERLMEMLETLDQQA